MSTPDATSADTLLSATELAKRWRCCGETIRRKERRGEIKAIRFSSRMLRYRISDVLAIESKMRGEV